MTFGVITSITFSAHPSPSIVHSSWAILVEPEASYFPELLAYVLSQWPSLEEAGMSMYCTSQSSPMENPFPIEGLPSQIAGIMGVSLLQDTDRQAMDKLWRPINETISQRWPDATFIHAPEEFPSWLAWFDKYRDTRDVGGNTIFASRLLDKKALTGDLDALAEAIKTVTDKVTRLTTFLVSGKGVHEAVPRGGSNSVLPAWRKAYVHASKRDRHPDRTQCPETDRLKSQLPASLRSTPPPNKRPLPLSTQQPRDCDSWHQIRVPT